ncbi:MAG: hypothetical protein BRC25_00490 [Parcubacteria group bacterium SW_6_46_9]|nr:MAG: hypothetical protein BRC25_00490 [Parcubacteria group bacterium SW_6_46_9]
MHNIFLFSSTSDSTTTAGHDSRDDEVGELVAAVKSLTKGESQITHGTNKWLLEYNGQHETLTVQPSFDTKLQDFGAVIPVPAEPKVQSGPENIFEHITDVISYEKPDFVDTALPSLPSFRTLGTRSAARGDEFVEVVNQKQVGSYTATVLRANSAQLLEGWLADNDYRLNSDGEDVLSHYTNLDGFHFVALKISSGSASKQATPDPVSISFASDSPFFPMYSMKAPTDEVRSFELYTLSQPALALAGADMHYKSMVSLSDLLRVPGLHDVGQAGGLHLTFSKVSYEPRNITRDSDLLVLPDSVGQVESKQNSTFPSVTSDNTESDGISGQTNITGNRTFIPTNTETVEQNGRTHLPNGVVVGANTTRVAGGGPVQYADGFGAWPRALLVFSILVVVCGAVFWWWGNAVYGTASGLSSKYKLFLAFYVLLSVCGMLMLWGTVVLLWFIPLVPIFWRWIAYHAHDNEALIGAINPLSYAFFVPIATAPIVYYFLLAYFPVWRLVL